MDAGRSRHPTTIEFVNHTLGGVYRHRQRKSAPTGRFGKTDNGAGITSSSLVVVTRTLTTFPCPKNVLLHHWRVNAIPLSGTKISSS